METQEDAIKYEFSGSPTIKVYGKDIFPTEQNKYALGCRLYHTPEGYKGSPTKEMILKRLSEFTKRRLFFLFVRHFKKPNGNNSEFY